MNLILAVLILFSCQVFGAIASTTVWEVESGATASDVNGGGFNGSNASPGTNYSIQGSAQFTATDLASSNASTNPCTVTSASHNFVSADNGNLIHFNTAGTNGTTGWYEIVSTSANAATLDRACGTAASMSGVTWHEGGALSLQTADSTWAAVVAAGNTVWVKNGTYVNGSLSLTDCSATHQCAWTGYNSSRGDNPTGSSRPVINVSGGSFDLGELNVVSNIIFTGTGTNMVDSDGQTVINNCQFLNTSSSTGHSAYVPGAEDLIVNSEFVSQGGFGITSSGNYSLIGNYIHDSGTCVRSSSASGDIFISNNIISGCMTNGVQFSAAEASLGMVAGNTIYGGESPLNSSVGISGATGASNIRVLNNIIYGWVTGIKLTTASTANWGNWNDLFNNTTNYTNWTAGASDINLTPSFASIQEVSGTAGTVSGETLTDGSANFSNVINNQDYLDVLSGTGVTCTPCSILITSHTTTSVTVAAAIGGSGTNINYFVLTGHNFKPGTNVRAVAFPGTFPASLTQGFLDIGAVQRKESHTSAYGSGGG